MGKIQQGLLSNKRLLKSEGFPKSFSVVSEIFNDMYISIVLILKVFFFSLLVVVVVG